MEFKDIIKDDFDSNNKCIMFHVNVNVDKDDIRIIFTKDETEENKEHWVINLSCHNQKAEMILLNFVSIKYQMLKPDMPLKFIAESGLYTLSQVLLGAGMKYSLFSDIIKCEYLKELI